MTTISLVPTDKTVDAWAAGVKRLQRMLPPEGFAFERWAMICMDCPRLLEQHSVGLLRLGWSAVDAFGAHPDAPAVAVRCYGLGVLMNGGEAVALTERSAGIKLPSGARHTFVRAANTGAVPLWTVER